MKINNCMLLMFKTFAIIAYLCVAAAQTFNHNNNVTGPMTTPFITTTLASILTNNYSYVTPFIPSVTPISFQHSDAMQSGSANTLAHHTIVPQPTNDMIHFGNEVKSLSELPLETLLKIKKHLEEMTTGMSHAENVVYPVYEHPSYNPPPQGGLSPGYFNLGGGTFHQPEVQESAEPSDGGPVVTNGHFVNNGDAGKFYDHGKTDGAHGPTGYGYGITPQPFVHKFKKKHAAEPWHEKPSKIQTIFQVSVTALSFLAFGGYLLCMILAALKAKGTAYYPANGQLMANQLNNNKRPVQNAPVAIRPNKNRRPSYGRRRRSVKNNNEDDDKGKTMKNGISQGNLEDGNLPFNHDQMYHALISIAEGYVKFNDFYHK